MKSRHLARSIAVQTLYSFDFSNKFELTEEVEINLSGLSPEEAEGLEDDVKIYASFLIRGVLENKEEIDQLISLYSKNRTIDRINIVDRNILRISFFTLLYCKEVHPHIVVDEAVKLSLEFSSDRNYKFVNGLLDTYIRTLQNDSIEDEGRH
ncbi:MAG: transcription antitermination factor NusB [Sphaerochaetaceae bacterium]